LAIELAAARTKLLPPQALLSRLGNRLKLLKGGARNLPARQQTLRATIDWSYELLDEHEKTLFGRLSVFAGGSTLEAIEEICDPQGDLEALEVVGALLEKSLLRRDEGAGGESRFVMLETIQEFAREKLEESGEAEETRRRHAEHYLALAETAEPELLGAFQGQWMRRLGTEFANLREAHAWSLEPGEGEERAGMRLRLAAALWRFWAAQRFEEGKVWLQTALERDTGGFPVLRAKALGALGFILLFQHDYERAMDALEEAIALYGELGDRSGAAFALANLGWATLHGDYRGRVPAFVREAEALMQEDIDDHARAILGIVRASAAIGQGDLDSAVLQLEESLALCRKLGDRRSAAMALFVLGVTELRRGHLERGATLLEEGAQISGELGDRLGTPYFAEGLAKLSAMRSRPVRAARLWGAAEALREQMGVSLSKFDRANSDYDRDLALVRSALDEATFEAAWAEGRAMSFEQAVGYLLGKPTTSGEEEGTRSPAIGTVVRPEDVPPDAEGAAAPR
jgi:tetratricopeptide (TPR) repeat protein